MPTGNGKREWGNKDEPGRDDAAIRRVQEGGKAAPDAVLIPQVEVAGWDELAAKRAVAADLARELDRRDAGR